MESFNIDDLDEFTRAYMECALRSSHTVLSDTDEEVNLDENHDITDIAPVTRDAMIADCKAFQEKYGALMGKAYLDSELEFGKSQCGHDFWLTRNGHGAGFWDRGLGEVGEALTEACGWKTDYPEVDLYIGDDGLIYA